LSAFFQPLTKIKFPVLLSSILLFAKQKRTHFKSVNRPVNFKTLCFPAEKLRLSNAMIQQQFQMNISTLDPEFFPVKA